MKRFIAILFIVFFSLLAFSQSFDFKADTTKGCAPLKVIFLNTTPDSIINNYSFEWIVESGKFSTQTDSIQNTYINPGSYTITMKVYDDSKNLVESIVKTDYIIVYNDPDVTITSDVYETCEDKSFNFSIQSIVADTTIDSYAWILSDGTIYNTPNPPAHTFGFADEFTVFLSIQDAHGCTNRERKSIVVKTYDDYPMLSFNVNKSRICEAELDAQFTNTTTDNTISNFHWDFGDGTTYDGKTPSTHKYSGFGNYYTVLSATSEHNCLGFSARTIQLINFQPQISISDEYPAVEFNLSTIKNNLNTQNPYRKINTTKEKQKFCPGTITFSDASSTQNVAWEWDFNNDGTIESEDDSFSIDIQDAGTYQIKLTVSNGTCTKEVIKTFEIEEKLQISASPTEDFYCSIPAIVQYNAKSNIANTSFLWALSDTTLSTEASFEKNFTEEGIYSANLWAISSNYCTASLQLSDNVEVTTPKLSYEENKVTTFATPRSGCAPLDVTFKALYTYKTDRDSISFISWDFNNDTKIDETDYFNSKEKTGELSHLWTYTQQGVYAYTITLETKKGCSVSNNTFKTTDSISVGLKPNVQLTFANELCASNDLAIAVSFDDETRYQSIYDTLFVTFTQIEPPANVYSTFDIETPVPPTFTMTLQDTIGVHYVSYTISDNGCQETINSSDNVLVNGPLVKIDVSPTDCDNPYKYQYTFNKNYGSEQWQWLLKHEKDTDWTLIAENKDTINIDFQDYRGRGKYWIKATAHNATTGCDMSDSILTTVTQIVGDFELQTYEPCLGDTAQFIVTTDQGQDIQSWTWHYYKKGQDDSYTFAKNINGVITYKFNQKEAKHYIFDTTSITSVTVEVSDMNGCKAFVSKPIKVFEAKAGFFGDILSDCLPFITNFTDTSTSEHEIMSRVWNFGNGESKNGNETTAQIEYTNKGNKTVSLTITDSQGCKGTASVSDYIKPIIPNAQFTVTHPQVCLGTEATFERDLTAYGYDNNLSHYTWDFGDNYIDSADGMAPTRQTHLYTKESNETYKVLFTAYSISPEGHECVDTSSQQIEIKSVGANIQIKSSDQCKEPGQKFVVYLDNSSYTSNIKSFDWWKYENGDSIYVSNKRTLQVVTFDNYGEQSLYLRTKSTFYGCEDTTNHISILVPGYEAQMKADKNEACVHEDITFLLTDTLNLYRYNAYWEFGDGSSIPFNGLTTTHAYDALAGTDNNTYKVQFIVDAEGCKPRDISTNITIYPVYANFTRGATDIDTIGCVPFSLQLYNTSTTIGNALYTWDFGNGEISHEENPKITLSTPNENIPISLSVTSSICSDTKTKNVHTYPVSTISIDIDSTLCYGESTPAKVTGDFTTIEWFPHKLVSNPYSSETNLQATQSEYVYIKTTNSYMCKNTDSIFVYVQQKPHYYGAPDSLLLFYTNGNDIRKNTTLTNKIIAGQTYNVNATSIPGITYLWSPATYLSCTECTSPNIDLSCTASDCLDFPESVDYTILMQDTIGCFSVDTTIHFNIIIDTKIALPEAFTPNNDGNNDIAYVRGWGIREFINVKIFNRWGQIVFETNDMSQGWDGTFNGEPQAMDTYAYTIKAIDMNGEELLVKGYITLLR